MSCHWNVECEAYFVFFNFVSTTGWGWPLGMDWNDWPHTSYSTWRDQKTPTYACEAHLISLEVLHIRRRFAMGNRLKWLAICIIFNTQETKELLTGSWSSTLWCLLLGHHKKKTHRVLPKHIFPKGLGSVGNHVTCVSQLATIYEATKIVIPLSTWTEVLKFWLLLTMIVVCKQYK